MCVYPGSCLVSILLGGQFMLVLVGFLLAGTCVIGCCLALVGCCGMSIFVLPSEVIALTLCTVHTYLQPHQLVLLVPLL